MSGLGRVLLGVLLASVCAVSCADAAHPEEDTFRTDTVIEFAGLLSIKDQVALDQRRTRVIEDAIAECMHERGFQYEPFYDAYKFNGAAQGLSTDFTSIDYAESRGFGLATSMIVPEVDLPTDPNTTYLLQQEDALQRSWSAALDGPTDDDAVTCRTAGDEALGSALGVEYDRLTELYAIVESSPEMAIAANDWQACAEAAGFPAPNRRALIGQFADRLRSISGEGPANDLAEGDVEVLAREEIAAAVATFECSQAYDAAFRTAFLAAAAGAE